MPAPFRSEPFTYGHYAALRLSCATLTGVLLVHLIGGVWRWHLRVGFGRLAGAVKIRPNRGRLEQRAPLGEGRPAPDEDIARALSLVRRSIRLWLAVCLLNGALCA